jgi:Stage II sporulation protein E (SpoIIE)
VLGADAGPLLPCRRAPVAQWIEQAVSTRRVGGSSPPGRAGASLIAAVAVASYRNSRRGDRGLVETVQAMDEGVGQQFGGERFATAVLGELDVASGVMRLVAAGHPVPLLVRNGKVVATPSCVPSLPVGLGVGNPAVAQLSLEPGDRLLLFTDGVVEARDPNGSFFGEDRLVDLLTREQASGKPASETMRRLVRAVIDHQEGPSAGRRDDAVRRMARAHRPEPLSGAIRDSRVTSYGAGGDRGAGRRAVRIFTTLVPT